jgi:hypothetical protein
MQEDIVGTLRTIGHDAETCSLCGLAYAAHELTPVDADPAHGVLSEREAICPACRRALAEGNEPVVPRDEDDDRV